MTKALLWKRVRDPHMCPHCGRYLMPKPGLTRVHGPVGNRCPGSQQVPRSIWDRRFLWNGERPPVPEEADRG